jgi:flagellar biosynthesis/type III secretory pathway chaperone
VTRDTLTELVAILRSEENVYLELRDLLQRERTAMAAMDAQELAEIVDAKEMIAAEAQFLEDTRLQVTRVLAAEIGLAEERPTLSQLVSALGESAEPLRAVHATLVAVLGAVQELVDANSAFAGHSLAQVHETLELYGRLMPIVPTYDPAAQTGGSGETGRIVRRTA